jgi:type IV secretion system protein VirB9
MKKLLSIFIPSLLLMSAYYTPALAIQNTTPNSVDKRLRTFTYDPNEVYKFVGHYRYQSSIEFAPDEEIATISLGDTVAWQIIPSGNRIFLKPVEPDATTNMTVISTKRIYHFELYGEEAEGIRDGEMIFQARFYYPGEGANAELQRFNHEEDLPDIQNEPEKYNFNYTATGSDYALPLKIFDDGEFTFFEFKNKNAEIPAIFLVRPDGSEEVINYRMQGNYVVVERVSSQFTLRSGDDVACIFNETSPLRKPIEKKRKFFLKE